MNSVSGSVQELVVILLFLSAIWGIPVAAAIWAVMTLRKLRAGQQALVARVEAIERLVHRS